MITLGATALKAARYRRLIDEVDPVSGTAARAWEVDAYALTDAEADAIYALRSWNLRRTLGWQLRGHGAGDVSLTGELGTATVRVEVTGEADYLRHPDGTHTRTLSLTLREQVV